MNDAPCDLDAAIPERLRGKRSGVILRAQIDRDGEIVERRVRNLSERGACVDNDGDLVAGASVIVSLGRVDRIAADVAWTKPNLAGLSFRKPIDIDAARQPRGPGLVRAGWAGEISDAYRRRA